MTVGDWKLTVRLSNGERFHVEVRSDSPVTQFKERIASVRADCPSNRQRLVYKGRILDDDRRTLTDYGIVDQATVFLVLGKPPANANANANSTASPAASTKERTSSSTATATNAVNGSNSTVSTSTSTTTGPTSAAVPNFFNPMLGGAANPWAAMAGHGTFNNPASSNSNSSSNSNDGTNNTNPFGLPMMNPGQMPSQEQMMSMMNSPIMQSLMDNPDLMRSVLQSSMQTNPQMQELMDRNPQLRQMWNDPAILDQAIQMMRNPSAMQQAMRQQDLAMSQLENLPGGFRALSNMYRDIQEPMMEAQQRPSPATLDTGAESSQSQGDGARGTAMPNPWGNPRSNTSSASSSSSSSSNQQQQRSQNSATAPSNPWASTTTSTSSSNSSSSSSSSNSTSFSSSSDSGTSFNPWAMGGGAGAMPAMNGMPQSPEQMERMLGMLDNPMMRQMMDHMVQQNPDMIRSMMEAQNPMFRQMFQNNPEMANNMVRQMMNPDNLRAMVQLQRSLGGMPGGMPSSGAAPGTGGLDFSSLLGGAGSRAGTGSFGNSGLPPIDLAGMMQQFQGMHTGTGGGRNNANVHPADRYRSQLQQLRDMGFDDEQASLAALQANHGNLNRAVDQLLSAPMAAVPAPASAPSSSVADGSGQQPSNGDSDNADANTDNGDESSG